MNRQAIVKENSERYSAKWIQAVAAWYVTDYVMNALNLTLAAVQLGQVDELKRTSFWMYVGDRSGWSHSLPYWISLVFPMLVIVFLAATRTELSWRTALKVGLVIVALQLIVAAVRGFHYISIFWAIEFVLTPIPGVVLPGPLVASLATRFDLRNEPKVV